MKREAPFELSRSDEVLLSFLHAEQERSGAVPLADLSSADWESILRKAARHGVSPLLYHRLKTIHPGVSIPADVVRKLRNSYLQNAGRNMKLYQELGRVLEKLRVHGIPVIILKGAHLAIFVYRNIALRPMADIDLLVRPADLKRVQDILIEQGYTISKEEIFCAEEHLPPYRKKDSTSIEIHFNIVAPPFADRVDVEKLFLRAQTCLFEGIEVLSLCPEDLLIHLCMHASYHHGFDNGILPLFDIATVFEHYKERLDWEQVSGRSKEWGVGKCIYVTLSLGEIIAGVSVPDRLRVVMDYCNDEFNAKKVAGELLFGNGTLMGPNIASLFGNTRLHEKVILFMHRAFPARKMMMDMNPGNKKPLSLFLLYIYRIKGLLMRHGQTSWKLFLGGKKMSVSAETGNKRYFLKNWLIR